MARNYLVAVLVIGILLAGCTPSPKSLYPAIKEQKEKISKVSLLVDIVCLDDTEGNIDRIDLPKNKRIGEATVKALKKYISLKGYPVVETFMFSGIHFIEANIYRLTLRGEEGYERTEITAVDVAGAEQIGQPVLDPIYRNKPPFLVDRKFKETPRVQKTIDSLFAKLKDMPLKKKKDDNLIMKLSLPGDLRAHIKGDTLIVVLVSARCVSAGKQFSAKSYLAAALSMSLAIERSYIEAKFFVIDTKTGELMWADEKWRDSCKFIKEGKFPKVACEAVKRFPKK